MATSLNKWYLFIITVVAVLLASIPQFVNSQCKTSSTFQQSYAIQGILNGPDHYYQNLIIQDIALSSNRQFNEIELRFDFTVNFVTDKCKPGLLVVNVLPPAVHFPPLIYYGFDISSSISPALADLAFNVIRDDVMITDSIIFTGIPVGQDSGLYISMNYETDPAVSSISIGFSRAGFYFTGKSYDQFRDRLLEVDDYYAAALLADSTLTWAEESKILESADRIRLVVSQIELDRLLSLIDPEKFIIGIDQTNDPAHLITSYSKLKELNSRLKAIINYRHFKNYLSDNTPAEVKVTDQYFERFNDYHEMSFTADFRFTNFLNRISLPHLTNGYLVSVNHSVKRILNLSDHDQLHWGKIFVKSFLARGEAFEIAGNQIRALAFYTNAQFLSFYINQRHWNAYSSRKVMNMRDSIAYSYMQISRKSALAENPSLAARYFRQAWQLYPENGPGTIRPEWLQGYPSWLYKKFEEQVVILIDLKQYQKSLDYLTEIQFYCQSNPAYPYPVNFHNWMKTVRNGLYINLLNKANDRVNRDELQEGEQYFKQAVSLRLRGGYRIEKDLLETRIDMIFKQLVYDQYVEEGQRFFHLHEYQSALYYYNKAWSLEKSGIGSVYPGLGENRNVTARQVISEIMSEGRIKAWANDYEGIALILQRLDLLLGDYRIPATDSLTAMYMDLKESVVRSKCQDARAKFDEMMEMADSARLANDFILAREYYTEATDLSMSNLGCNIHDDQAWYQKVTLEMPAVYQQMESGLDQLLDISWQDYLDSFLELRSFYNKHKLLNQGVTIIPLFDRAIKASDRVFLEDATRYYLDMRDGDRALRFLERMRILGFSSRSTESIQKKVAEMLAVKDVNSGSPPDPKAQMKLYTGQEKWYRPFKWAYKFTWLDKTGWKLKYWPLILKK